MKLTSRPATLMIASLIVTAALYTIPYVRVLAWPLVLLSTLAHELGHGLAAAVLGGRFEALRMYPDASGVATWSGPLGRIGVATVAGAGLIGPALAAFCMLAFGRTPRGARMMLGCVGTGLVVVALLVARNPFGFVFILLLAGTLIAVATRSDRLAQMTVVLIAVQLALAVFSRSDYLFTRTAMTSAGPAPSDVTVMASALFLPYWFWGILCGALSLALLAAGARRFLR
jgi:TM2 domain-containing membrane protein YozV